MSDWLKQPKRRVRGRHTKKRASRWERWREIVWPSMGVHAFGRWALLQLVRSGKNPHLVALGFAFGMAVNFTPWIGFHVAVAWGLCWFFNGGYLAAFLATLIGNPLTFPFFWGLSFEVGRKIINVRPGFDERDMATMTFSRLWYHFDRLFWDLLLPLSVGGVVLGIVCGAVTYFMMHDIVRRYHEAKSRRTLERKLAREMARGHSAAGKDNA